MVIECGDRGAKRVLIVRSLGASLQFDLRTAAATPPLSALIRALLVNVRGLEADAHVKKARRT